MNKMYANRYACMYKRADTAEDNVDTQFATEGNLLKNVEIFRTGVFREELFEEDYVQSMVDNFYDMKKSKVFSNVPVRKGHQNWLDTRNSTDELIGYIKDIRLLKKGKITVKEVATDKDGEKIYNESGKAVRKSRKIDDVRLLADLEITEPDALGKITRTTWRDRSIEFGKFADNNGNESYPVLMGVAFVDIPQVDQLASLFNYYSKRDFDVVGLDNKQLNLENKEEIMPPIKEAQSYKATPPQDEAIEMEAESSGEAITIGEIYPEEEVKEEVVEEVVEEEVKEEVVEEDTQEEETKEEDKVEEEVKEEGIAEEDVEEKEEEVVEEDAQEEEVKEEVVEEDVEEETKEEDKVENFTKTDFDVKEFEKLRRYKMKHERANRDNYVNALVKAGFSTPAMGEIEKELIASFFAMEGGADFRGAKQQFKLFKQLKESTPKVWEKKDDLQVTDDETPKKDLKEEAANEKTSSAEEDALAAREKIEDAGLKAKEADDLI